MKTYLKLFWTFFKIGMFTIGGGLVMLPLIEREIVDRQKWISSDEILDIFAVSQTLPGVIAINSSIYVGYRVAGVAGAVFSVLGTAIPSLIVILLIAMILPTIADNIYLQKAFSGIRIGIAAIIFVTGLNMAKRVINNNSNSGRNKDIFSLLLVIASFVCVIFLDISAVYIIFFGGLSGLTVLFIRRGK